MVYFQTKNPNLGKFLRTVDWKMLMYCMAIWNILETFGTYYDHLVHFVFIFYILVLVSCTKKNLATLLNIGDAISGCYLSNIVSAALAPRSSGIVSPRPRGDCSYGS
jgi:hypothetical protein